jgi:hypothetical protein
LAMCALQLASRLEKIHTDHLIDGVEVGQQLDKLVIKLQQAVD